MTTPREKFLEFLRYHRYEQDEARQIADKAAEFFAEPGQPSTPQPAAVGESHAIEHGPFAVMAGAPWNVLDSRGCRIACCGGDSNADWERFGPAIAAAIVESLNQSQLTSRKYLNAECGLSGCQWLVGEHQSEVYRKRMAEVEADNARLTAALREAEERAERLEAALVCVQGDPRFNDLTATVINVVNHALQPATPGEADGA